MFRYTKIALLALAAFFVLGFSITANAGKPIKGGMATYAPAEGWARYTLQVDNSNCLKYSIEIKNGVPGHLIEATVWYSNNPGMTGANNAYFGDLLVNDRGTARDRFLVELCFNPGQTQYFQLDLMYDSGGYVGGVDYIEFE